MPTAMRLEGSYEPFDEDSLESSERPFGCRSADSRVHASAIEGGIW